MTSLKLKLNEVSISTWIKIKICKKNRIQIHGKITKDICSNGPLPICFSAFLRNCFAVTIYSSDFCKWNVKMHLHSRAAGKASQLASVSLVGKCNNFWRTYSSCQRKGTLGSVREGRDPNCEKSLSFVALSPGVLQAMSSHLVHSSSSCASTLDSRDPPMPSAVAVLYRFTYTSLSILSRSIFPLDHFIHAEHF